MKLKEALAMGIENLKNANTETPVVDAGVLLCSAADCDRTYLYAHGEHELDPAGLKRYKEYLGQRTAGTPVQYITGHCGFMSLDFVVGPGVLIPRPDTEILVETAVELFKKTGGGGSCICPDWRSPEILDIGTGSGCIAVSVAYMLKDSRVTAVDVSEEALDVARLNAVRNGVDGRVEFIRSDLFSNLSGRKFDVILSNPPYIRSGEIEGLQREVRDFEPRAALDGGSDGLDFYRLITGRAHLYLKKGGYMLFEVGIVQASEVVKLMEGHFRNTAVIRDLAGIERVVRGRLVF